jgi:thiamine-monophosphate kinase
MSARLIREIGEKAIIKNFIRPLFNELDDPFGVGDDCGMISVGDQIVLLSTDRVPADLTAFRLGILDYEGIGGYLARLNLSDIAACGGKPMGLLLNLGVPETLPFSAFQALCKGFATSAAKWNCPVLGGDITAAVELSVSATAIGVSRPETVLNRRGAKPGDSVFLSRPPGLTPAAFQYFLGERRCAISEEDEELLRDQFTSLEPMLDLGQLLASSGECTSCMDNTDGIGQSLSELADASRTGFSVWKDLIPISSLLSTVSQATRTSPFEFMFDGGADFSLIGTLKGEWTTSKARARFGPEVSIIGRVQDGAGVALIDDQGATELQFKGWNYFLKPSSR